MVDPKASLEHVPHTENLRQRLICALEAREAPLAEHVDLTLLAGGGEVKRPEAIRRGVDPTRREGLGRRPHRLWQVPTRKCPATPLDHLP